MPKPIQVIDRGWVKITREMLSGLDAVKIGVQGEDANAKKQSGSRSKPADNNASSATNAQVAFWNEFGTSRIPERSFLRRTIDVKQSELANRAARLWRKVGTKVTKAQALGILGEKAAAMVRREISRGIPPANAPSTIKKKGSSKPLVNFSQLKNSISWALDK